MNKSTRRSFGDLKVADRLPSENRLATQFHVSRTVVCEATKNTLIPIMINPIMGQLREQRIRLFTVAGGAEHSQYHYKCILDAIFHRDPDAARGAMRDHLQQIREDSKVATASPP